MILPDRLSCQNMQHTQMMRLEQEMAQSWCLGGFLQLSACFLTPSVLYPSSYRKVILHLNFHKEVVSMPLSGDQQGSVINPPICSVIGRTMADLLAPAVSLLSSIVMQCTSLTHFAILYRDGPRAWTLRDAEASRKGGVRTAYRSYHS